MTQKTEELEDRILLLETILQDLINALGEDASTNMETNFIVIGGTWRKMDDIIKMKYGKPIKAFI